MWSAYDSAWSRFATDLRQRLGETLGRFSFQGCVMDADINNIIARMESAMDEEHGIVLTRDELDEVLWTIGELEIGNQMQAHMIDLLEAERKPTNLH